MSDSSLETLARAAGISVRWTDAFGDARSVSDDALHGLLEAMGVPSHDQAHRQASLRLIEERTQAMPMLVTADVDEAFELPCITRSTRSIAAYDEQAQPHTLPLIGEYTYRAPSRPGYYQLDLGHHSLTLAVAPRRCYGISDALSAQKQRAWGLGAQVYALRHSNDGGLGDSRAVAELADTLGRAGGDALALSPLHATSPVAGHYSPYSPSHRGFLNWLHADPAQLLGTEALNAAIQQSGLVSTWQHAQEGKLIDWPLAYALRRNVFRLLHEQFAHASGDFHNDLECFAAQGGDALRRHTWIAARQAQAMSQGTSTSWKAWKDDWQDEASARSFAQRHAVEVDFEIFLQWLSARCWEKTCKLAREAGQRIGLIWDLAVGFEPGGGEAWAWREHVLDGLELGAPPDAFNPVGQRWGITSYSPWGLKASGFRPFIELLRANMARSGGIRIDHIIGFRHLWVSPQGRPSNEGAYIQQPMQDLLRLTALESWRHRCIVIGEDLGTVPEGLRDVLAARGVLGLDVLLFTRDENGDFLAPALWRNNAVATTTTHDMPPLAGWREGLDVEQLARVQRWDDAKLLRSMQQRKKDVARLDETFANASPSFRRRPARGESTWTCSALRSEESSLNTRPKDTESILSASHNALKLDSGLRRNDGEAPDTFSQDLSASIQKANIYFDYLTQTPSPLILIPLEDALALKQQPNLPGTVTEHPNWQHRLPQDALDKLQPFLQSIDTSIKEVTTA